MTITTCLRYIRRRSSVITDRFISTPPIQKPLRFYRTIAISPRTSTPIIDRFISSGPIHKPFQIHFSSSSYSSSSGGNDIDYPTGDFDFVPHSGFKKYLVKLKTLFALPSERVKHGSVLRISLEGTISDGPVSSDSKVLSLPQLTENLLKAAFDPRVSAVFLYVGTFDCGWAKVDEIRRQILNFRKSGKVIVAFVLEIRPKSYYIACACKEIYAPPSAYVYLFGIAIHCVSLPSNACNKNHEDSPEALTAVVDNVYSNWLDKICLSTGKKREDVENLVNEGVYVVDKLKQEGFISDVLYEREVFICLKEKLGIKSIPIVFFREYSLVRKCTVGIQRDGAHLIAIIRVYGTIGSNSKKFIDEIRRVIKSTEYKALIIRINCSGGDFHACHLMWKETICVATKIPVVASLSDVAVGAGYYIATGANVIVSENLSLTGKIGVPLGNADVENLYQKTSFKKIVSWGEEIEQRSFDPLEAHKTYIQFRDNAALSRSMTINKMEEVAKGRVWIGKDAASHGLVDVIGGLSCAIAIAKFKAKIPQNSEVMLVELSK